MSEVHPHYQSDLAACKRDLVPHLEALGFGFPEHLHGHTDWEYAHYICYLYNKCRMVDDRLPFIVGTFA